VTKSILAATGVIAALHFVIVTPTRAPAQAIHPQWSPDGEWIAYYQRHGERAGLMLVRADGSGFRILTDGPDYDANPTWSPDGARLAFARGIGGMRGTWDVFVLDVATGGVERLTDTPEREMHTSWSPDGRHIAFIRTEGDGWDVYVMRADGGDLRRLTDTPAAEFHPKWSPDSRSVAFDSGDGAVREIRSVNLDGGEPRRIVSLGDSAFAVAPAWSPDGAWLAFSLREEPGEESLRLLDVASGDLRSLAGQTGGGAFWSPDGTRVAFHSDRTGEYAIYVVTVEGGEVRRISP
jgi:TolB protein